MPCQTSHFKTEKNEVQRHQVTVYNLTKKKKNHECLESQLIQGHGQVSRDGARLRETVKNLELGCALLSQVQPSSLTARRISW